VVCIERERERGRRHAPATALTRKWRLLGSRREQGQADKIEGMQGGRRVQHNGSEYNEGGSVSGVN
jgi:hypothetical protein